MSIPARYKVVKALAIVAGLAMALGIGFTPAQAATDNPIAAESFVVTSTSCEAITASFVYANGPGSYAIVRKVDGARVFSGTVASATGTVSGLVISGQPVGVQTYGLYNVIGGMPITTRVDVTIAPCVVTPPPLKSVTPAAPTFVDKVGTKDDTYTVPSTVGVKYEVGGVVVVAGTYPAKGTVTVVAQAKPGFVLKGASSWSHKFTNLQVPGGVVYNPKASITSQCEFADGERTGDTVVDVVFDNSQLPKSTSEIGFELVSVVDGGVAKFYRQSVAAGKVAMLQKFYSSKSGKTVKLTVNALDTTLKTYSFKTKKCAVVAAPKPNKPVPPRVVPSGPTVKVPVSNPTTVKKRPVNSQVSKAPVKRTSNLPVPVKVQTDGGELGTNGRGILPLGVGFMFIAGGLVYMSRRREARS